jgi:hypothetical protein
MNNNMTGVATHYKDLDEITSGLQPSDLILIAARPSMGKTALGLNIAQNAAFRGKKTAAFFSLEMSAEQLIMRIIASETEVNSKKIKLGMQSDAEWKKITLLHSAVVQSDINLYIDDTSSISVGEVRSKLRKLKATVGLDIVVIDYLQLMSTTLRTENRQQEISMISREPQRPPSDLIRSARIRRDRAGRGRRHSALPRQLLQSGGGKRRYGAHHRKAPQRRDGEGAFKILEGIHQIRQRRSGLSNGGINFPGMRNIFPKSGIYF